MFNSNFSILIFFTRKILGFSELDVCSNVICCFGIFFWSFSVDNESQNAVLLNQNWFDTCDDIRIC